MLQIRSGTEIDIAKDPNTLLLTDSYHIASPALGIMGCDSLFDVTFLFSRMLCAHSSFSQRWNALDYWGPFTTVTMKLLSRANKNRGVKMG